MTFASTWRRKDSWHELKSNSVFATDRSLIRVLPKRLPRFHDSFSDGVSQDRPPRLTGRPANARNDRGRHEIPLAVLKGEPPITPLISLKTSQVGFHPALQDWCHLHILGYMRQAPGPVVIIQHGTCHHSPTPDRIRLWTAEFTGAGVHGLAASPQGNRFVRRWSAEQHGPYIPISAPIADTCP